MNRRNRPRLVSSTSRSWLIGRVLHVYSDIELIGFVARYGPQTNVGKLLGNARVGDGALFHGPGFVQLTGRRNYTKAKSLTGVDLLTEPDRAKNPELTDKIAIQGDERWLDHRGKARTIYQR
jgi:hypothetical protein